MTNNIQQQARKRNPISIQPGERFGRLVLVREVESREGARWGLFQCDCGSKVEIRLKSVLQLPRSQKSCGCIKSEQCRQTAAAKVAADEQRIAAERGREQECNACHVPKPLSEYYRRRSCAEGVDYTYAKTCKSCKAEKRKEKEAENELWKSFYSPF